MLPTEELCWVILTLGDRVPALSAAVASVATAGGVSPVVVVNGATPDSPLTLPRGIHVRLMETGVNLGIPRGRDLGLRATHTGAVGFLDDDAEFRGDLSAIVTAFDADARLAAVALRLVDDVGATARRHVPRMGGKGADESGEVALFLGGACAIRREAYEQVGGYFTELFYGHEEVELSWRLIDAGWKIRYLADVEVFHPRTEISRHADGWRLTGRNRVWIARRTLPWPIAVVHVVIWLGLGTLRAPRGDCRSAYLGGWWSGWRGAIDRRPISWRGVWRLTRLGRPPIV